MELAGARVESAGAARSDNLLKRRTAAVAVAGVLALLALHSPAPEAGREASRIHGVDRGYALSALSRDLAATVLTLEPGIVGIQNVYHFTPKTLQGSVCTAPNTCQAVDYLTLPGDNYNEKGADKLLDAVKNLPADGSPAILMGYSQGAQVIYSALRRWEAKPATAPDPSRVSWVSIGNPDNPIGGVRNSLGTAQPRPVETPYAGVEVIRQYDGWADWPDDQSNLLAVFNAVVGMTTVHSNYFDVDINDPANVRYTPADGSPGNVTYVWVPNPVLPMVAGFGPLAPTLDSWLRPTVEAGYDRPVTIPAPGPKAAAAQPVPRGASTTVGLNASTAVGDVTERPRARQLPASQRGGGERRQAPGAQPRTKRAASTSATRRSR